ncbi:MAG: glycosyltransferase, partial [Candidatus Omnitrophica bacterium]|nr:glycosyltransferase [Candidatus Omnitrophota bacterium]
SQAQTELTQAKDLLAKKETELSESRSTLGSLNENLSLTQKELSQAQTELSQTKGLLAKKETELSESKSTAAKTKDELSLAHDQLGQLSQNISRIQDNLSAVERTLQQKQKELESIYSSEGYRFLLRPMWLFLWKAKEAVRFIKYASRELVYLIILAPLYLMNLFIFMILLIERTLWAPLILLRKNNTSKLNQSRIYNKDKNITIVIPNYSGCHYLKECLSSIFKIRDFQDNKHEVLIVDDASSDDSVAFVRENFPQVTLICNKKNLGFGASCNLGIKQARNKIIILLNNDIIVSDDFHKPLIAHLDNEDIFSVSPRLYEWDRKTFATGMYVGDFQHGYIHIWNERDIHGYPVINTAQPTVFGIGCAVCFRKSDFLALGGLDEIFKPYCWEDIDLSYRALKRNLRVVYEPKSTVFHKVHGTIGPFKRSIEIKNELLFTWKNITDFNMTMQHFLFLPLYFLRRKMERKQFLRGYLMALNWLPLTIAHRMKEEQHILRNDKEVLSKPLEFFNYSINIKNKLLTNNPQSNKTLLLITPFLPLPVKSGGQVKMFTSLNKLSEKYDIILISFIRHLEEKQYLPELNKLCKQVHTVVCDPTWKSRFDKISLPIFVKYFYSKEMEETIKNCLQAHPIDLVQVEYANMAYYAQSISGIPKILVEHDASIYTLNKSCEKPAFGKIFRFLDWMNFKRFQKNIYRYFDKIIAFTDEDARIIQKATSADKINIIPISIDVDNYKPHSDCPRDIDILFIGHMLHYPNIDGLRYFIKKILPLIKENNPKFKFNIIGSGLRKEEFGIKDNENISVTGEVGDVKEYLARAKILVVPIRLGSGIKVKILEAMAAGVPVVATEEAASGLKAVNGKDLYIASSREDFANKVLDLLQDKTKRNTMASNAKKVIKDYYDVNKTFEQEELLRRRLMLSTMEPEEEPIDENINIPSAGLAAGWDFPFKCNYKCPYCLNNSYSDPAYDLSGKLIVSFQEWVSFWRRMYQKYGEIKIVIAGGEPTVYPAFFELMKKITLWHRVEICTNLSFDIRKVVNIFSPQRLALHPSFHPHCADLDEYLKKMRALIDNGWVIEPIIVAYPPLLDKLAYFQKRFLEIGTGVCILPFMGEYQSRTYPKEYTTAEKDLISLLIKDHSNDYYLNNISPRGKLCRAGMAYFRVSPDGSIFRCASDETRIGNVKDKEFGCLDKAMPCTLDFCKCSIEFIYLEENIVR